MNTLSLMIGVCTYFIVSVVLFTHIWMWITEKLNLSSSCGYIIYWLGVMLSVTTSQAILLMIL